ncbi:MAG: PorP/SprF family type IX secretion system membrane protein [Bacteroidaceae bacterium]|nr:PorP/SprF family type IX secretion system membrane protein [Bacteroidaceae bacterium]
MRRLLWILLLVCAVQVNAQYDPVLSHSWAMLSYYNPAAAGVDGQLDVKALYSAQMTGFEGAPKTILITADMPLFFLGPSHGAGLGFMNDKVGLFSTKQIYLQYAFHLKILDGRLSIGARPVLLMETFDGSKVDVDQESSSDPAFAKSEVNGNAFDLDVGLRYRYKDVWYVGVSAMHLLTPTIKMGDDKLYGVTVNPMFHLAGGYRVQFHNPLYAMYTHAQLRTDFKEWRGDIHARFAYDGEKHKLYGGVNYSPTYSVGICLGYKFHGVNIGYSYEMYTGGIGLLQGTHEVMIGFQTDLNKYKKGKNRHQSVRLL